MKAIQLFLIFFYILDQSYEQCKEDDLGGFLGAISPELWADGVPMDKAIFNDWQRVCNPEMIDEKNILEKTYIFLDYYEKAFGFNFSKTKQWIKIKSNEETVKRAFEQSQAMCQKFDYNNL